jgi:hypothetical protein
MPGASREAATALTTNRQIRPLQAEGVLRDVVEDHRAAPTVSRKIFFEKGVFLCAVRHRDFRIRHQRTEARAGTIRTEFGEVATGTSDKQLTNDIRDRGGPGQLSLG